ncbi:hypothetical protein J2X55_000560 [Microbacterium sp. 1154]|uniref:hypothetical protein n=1 Tax=Microbacterium sp. 1154 TaxID=2817733 RepID=UPI002861DF8C|nr:hypothetical protein [Microbacterium sp. 1154]MDR6689661.1 hypothetical protein [Microbacterium sp. 1154]
MSRSSPLNAVLGSSAFWRYSATASLMRAPVLMAAVALTTTSILMTGTLAAGAVLAAWYVGGTVVATPVMVHVVGLLPLRRVLRWQMFAHAVLWVGIAACWLTGSAPWISAMLAAGAGAIIAGNGGAVRALMSGTVPAEAARSASTVDVTFLDILIFLAPLAAALASLIHPVAPVATVAVVGFAAAAAVSLTSRRIVAHGDQGREHPHRRGGRLRWDAQGVSWILFSAVIGLYFGAMEVGAPGLVVTYGFEVSLAWMIFLVLSATSVFGGWVDASRPQSTSEDRWALVGAASMSAGCLLLAFTPPLAWAVIGLLLTGLPVATLLGLRSHRIDVHVSPPQRAGYLSWAFAAQNAGFACASLLLAHVSQPTMFVCTGVLVPLALLLALRTRHPRARVVTSAR